MTALVWGAGRARAASAPAASRAAVVQALSDCRKIAASDARLDCYDKAADAFDQAEAKGQVVVVDREKLREVRRQSFGFVLPSISLFNRGPQEPPIDRVTVEVSDVRRTGDGRWVMATADGAIWVQADTEVLDDAPHPGSRMNIRRGLVGSYYCFVDGQRAMGCRRSNERVAGLSPH